MNGLKIFIIEQETMDAHYTRAVMAKTAAAAEEHVPYPDRPFTIKEVAAKEGPFLMNVVGRYAATG